MSPKRQIKGKEFLADLRAGMTTGDLLEKYSLTPDGLRKIFRILLDSSVMEKVELDGFEGLYEPQGANAVRRFPRRRIDFPLWVYDGVDQLKGFEVLDISERGLGIKGIQTYVGDQRTFIVRFQRGSVEKPFVFEAKCRWLDEETLDLNERVAGFEITSISKFDEQALQRVMLL